MACKGLNLCYKIQSVNGVKENNCIFLRSTQNIQILCVGNTYKLCILNLWYCTYSDHSALKVEITLIKTSQLIVYKEIMAVCSQIHSRHINTLCGQNVVFVNVKLVVHILTTGL